MMYRFIKFSIYTGLLMALLVGCIQPSSLLTTRAENPHEPLASQRPSVPVFAQQWFAQSPTLDTLFQHQSWYVRFDGMVMLHDGTQYIPVLPVIASVANKQHPQRALEAFSFGPVQTVTEPSSPKQANTLPDIIAFESGAYLLRILPTTSGKWTLPRRTSYPESLRVALVWPDVILPENLSIPVELQTLFAPVLDPYETSQPQEVSPPFQARVQDTLSSDCRMFGHGLSPATNVTYTFGCRTSPEMASDNPFNTPKLQQQTPATEGIPIETLSMTLPNRASYRFALLTHPIRLVRYTTDSSLTLEQQTLLSFVPQSLLHLHPPESSTSEKNALGWLMLAHPTEHRMALYHPQSLNLVGHIDFPDTANPGKAYTQHGRWLWIADAEKAAVYEFHYQEESGSALIPQWVLTRILPGVSRASHLNLMRTPQHPYPFLALSSKHHGLIRWVYLPTGKSAGETLTAQQGASVKQAWVLKTPQNEQRTLGVLVESKLGAGLPPQYTVQYCGMPPSMNTAMGTSSSDLTATVPEASSAQGEKKQQKQQKKQGWWHGSAHAQTSSSESPAVHKTSIRSAWQCQVDTSVTLPNRPLLWTVLHAHADQVRGLWSGFSTRGITSTDQTQVVFTRLEPPSEAVPSMVTPTPQEWLFPELILMPSITGSPSSTPPLSFEKQSP